VERIGQERRVHEVHLLAADTAEESLVARLVRRARRAALALDGLRAGATDMQVAGVVLGREPLEESRPASQPGPGAAPTGLRTWAHAEAARLENLRAIAGKAAGGWPDGRPPVVIRRRPGRGRGALCGVRLVFTSADQRVVWDTLIGATVVDAAAPLDRLGSTSWIVQTIERLDHAVAATAPTMLAALTDSLAAPMDLAARREQAIADGITAERARLAAVLLQPGLFDRRAERFGAAQGAVLDEALERCRSRLNETARTRQPAVGHRLAFAVLNR
jgi:hypothetical protein